MSATFWRWVVLILGGAAASADAASIAGRVTNAANGDPIPGAVVFIVDEAFEPVAQAPTDTLGDYVVGGLAAGTYFAATTPAGFAGEIFDDVPIDAAEPPTQIVLAAMQDRTGVDFALDPQRRISGTVTQQGSATPIEGVIVAAAPVAPGTTRQATSLADGTYALFVDEGEYTVTASGSGFLGEFSDGSPCHVLACDTAAAARIVVGASDVAGVDFALLAGGRIEGTVRDAATGGLVTDSVTIRVARASGDLLDTIDSVTTSDGNWTTTVPLPGASYRAFAVPDNGAGYRAQVHDGHDCTASTAASCSAVAADPIAVTAGAATAIGFELTPTTGRASGRITAFAGGAALAGVAVHLTTTVDGASVYDTTTQADGTFLFTGVDVGDYFVRAAPTPPLAVEYFPNVQCLVFSCALLSSGTPQKITIGAGTERTGLEFALAPVAAVAVTLRNVDTGAAVGGELRVERNGRLSTEVESANGGGPTDVLLPGGGTLRFAGWGRNTCGTSGDTWCLGRLYPDIPCPQLVCRFEAGQTITLAKGQRIEGVELAMQTGAIIAGLVTVPGGNAGNVIVEAVSGNLVAGASVPDGENRYAITGLGAGPYLVRTRNTLGLLDEVFDDVPCPGGNCVSTDATPIAPTIGTTTGNVDFALGDGSEIAGIVRTSAGNVPLPGARITVYDDAGVERASTQSITGGVFRTPALPGGRWFVKASATAHLPSLFDGVACTAEACDPLGATPIDLVVPADRENVSITLQLDPDTGAGEPNAGPQTPTTVYINRCAGGCTVSPGPNDSRTNRSSIVRATSTLSAFPHGDAMFEELVACLRDIYRPFNVDIVDVDPGNVPHHENLVAGVPGQAGFSSSTLGVSPFTCGIVPNSVTFTFAGLTGNLAELCHASAMEIAHSFGLEHELDCEDPMTYLSGCGAKRFVDADVPCGENAARPCTCTGSATQNSFETLTTAVGFRLAIFADGFETDAVAARMKANYAEALKHMRPPLSNTCSTHPERGLAPPDRMERCDAGPYNAVVHDDRAYPSGRLPLRRRPSPFHHDARSGRDRAARVRLFLLRAPWRGLGFRPRGRPCDRCVARRAARVPPGFRDRAVPALRALRRARRGRVRAGGTALRRRERDQPRRARRVPAGGAGVAAAARARRQGGALAAAVGAGRRRAHRCDVGAVPPVLT